MRDAIKLYMYASAIVGAPILLIILIVGMQRALCTLTCETAGYQCERAFGSRSTIQEAIGSIVDDEHDVVVKPKRR